MHDQTKIIKMILKHPLIDVSIKNSRGEPANDFNNFGIKEKHLTF